MGMIRIKLPPKSLYTFGPIVLHDMQIRREILRLPMGLSSILEAEEPIDLGIAWGRGHTPPVKLRFTAQPGHSYRLFWLTADFGAGMGALDMTTGLLHR